MILIISVCHIPPTDIVGGPNVVPQVDNPLPDLTVPGNAIRATIAQLCNLSSDDRLALLATLQPHHIDQLSWQQIAALNPYNVRVPVDDEDSEEHEKWYSVVHGRDHWSGIVRGSGKFQSYLKGWPNQNGKKCGSQAAAALEWLGQWYQGEIEDCTSYLSAADLERYMDAQAQLLLSEGSEPLSAVEENSI